MVPNYEYSATRAIAFYCGGVTVCQRPHGQPLVLRVCMTTGDSLLCNEEGVRLP
jgi:hypothetical protein